MKGQDINSGPGFNLEVRYALEQVTKNDLPTGKTDPISMMTSYKSHDLSELSEQKREEISQVANQTKEKISNVSEETGIPEERIYKALGIPQSLERPLAFQSGILPIEEFTSYVDEGLKNLKENQYNAKSEWFDYLDKQLSEMPDEENSEMLGKIKRYVQKFKKPLKVASVAVPIFLAGVASSGCLNHGPPGTSTSDAIYSDGGEVYIDQANISEGIQIYTESMNLSDYNVVDLVPFGQDLPNNETVAMEQALEGTMEKALETEGADAVFVDIWKNPVFGGSNSGVGLILDKTNQFPAAQNLTDLVSPHFNLPVIDLNQEIPAQYSLGLGPNRLFTLRDSDYDGVPDYKDIDDNNNGIPDANETGFREKPKWQLFNDSVITQQVNPNLDPEDQIKALGILRTQKENFREALVYQLQGPSKDTKVPVNYY